MILDTDPVTFGTQNLSFGRPGAPLWHPGGPGADPGAPGSRRKDTLGSRLGFLSILGGFRDPFLIAFWEPWTKMSVFVMLVSRSHFVVILGSKSGRLGLQKQAFGVRGVVKTNFSQKLGGCCFEGTFLMFLGGLGTNFHDF